jgi:hypothetical protein
VKASSLRWSCCKALRLGLSAARLTMPVSAGDFGLTSAIVYTRMYAVQKVWMSNAAKVAEAGRVVLPLSACCAWVDKDADRSYIGRPKVSPETSTNLCAGSLAPKRASLLQTAVLVRAAPGSSTRAIYSICRGVFWFAPHTGFAGNRWRRKRVTLLQARVLQNFDEPVHLEANSIPCCLADVYVMDCSSRQTVAKGG